VLLVLMFGAEGGVTAARSYHRFNRLREKWLYVG
jgi:hypothetical protein